MLAANTAFNGFPVLASLLGPRQLPARTSSRTAATGSSSPTGSSCSARVAALLIVAFDAQVTRLIQLYILGVFLSFTLSQPGMVRHWQRATRRRAPAARRAGCAASRRSTRPAPSVTGVVFVIVLVTKFAAGRMDRRARGADAVRRR